MKVAIIGSRTFNDYEYLKLVMRIAFEGHEIELIVSGGADGADSLGEKWAEENNIPTQIFYPDWARFGKPAGMIRNKDIVDAADWVVAFWDGESRGTHGAIKYAEKKEKPFIVMTDWTRNENPTDQLH